MREGAGPIREPAPGAHRSAAASVRRRSPPFPHRTRVPHGPSLLGYGPGFLYFHFLHAFIFCSISSILRQRRRRQQRRCARGGGGRRMRLPAAARLVSERQAGGYRCATEEGGPGHRTQWVNPATRTPLPLLPVRSPPPASAPLTTVHPTSQPRPSPLPHSPQLPPPPSFLWWRRSPTLARCFPVSLTPHRFPLVSSLHPGVRSGRGPTRAPASGVGGRGWPARSSPEGLCLGGAQSM